ncbi:MAG: carboxyltransferase domain-containing protein, partial [Candidatus Accumulibacter sp.]|nr:carboxyltransferase domain-containing protein [Accumulibacter sp.]
MNYRILSLGDAALTIEFGEVIDRRLLAAVAAADQALLQAVAAGQLPGVVETVPTFRSLTVIHDPLRGTRSEVEAAIHAVLRQTAAIVAPRGRVWQLPVCYGDQLASCGPDLDQLAAACGLGAAEVVRLHAGGCYEVYMLGNHDAEFLQEFLALIFVNFHALSLLELRLRNVTNHRQDVLPGL